MCAVVTPGNVDAVLAICDKWGVQATVIGEVTDGGTLVITWRGETIVDVPPRTVAHDGPVYNRPYARPGTQDELESQTSAHLPRPSDGAGLKGDLLALLATANVGDKSWVTDQYDRYVRGNTVLSQPDDAGVIRVDEATGRGVALSLDGNGRFARLDPYNGAKLALAEAYRNVAVSGAIPIAVTNCLNFGSPEDPGVMWQFEQAVTGLADGALELGTPVTGGNVSFYNQTGDTAILPTPVIGVLGVIDDVERRTPLRYKDDGELIYLLGDTRDELDGSAWAGELHGHLGGRPPLVDLKHEKVLAEILVAASRDGMASAAHDVSDGGVAVALVEMALRSNIGLRFWAPDNLDPFAFLFSESAGRALVVIARSEEVRFTEMCAARQMAATRIGVVDSGLATEHGFTLGTQVVEMTGQFAVPLDELRAAHVSALPQVVA